MNPDFAVQRSALPVSTTVPDVPAGSVKRNPASTSRQAVAEPSLAGMAGWVKIAWLSTDDAGKS